MNSLGRYSTIYRAHMKVFSKPQLCIQHTYLYLLLHTIANLTCNFSNKLLLNATTSYLFKSKRKGNIYRFRFVTLISELAQLYLYRVRVRKHGSSLVSRLSKQTQGDLAPDLE